MKRLDAILVAQAIGAEIVVELFEIEQFSSTDADCQPFQLRAYFADGAHRGLRSHLGWTTEAAIAELMTEPLS